ncbi:NAD(P)H-dependent oxidoreductase [Pseudomonas sp. BN411]|uniref:FMN-dependent NADH-azoreductase n=1 Tax=Pseudomonas sp. BN411 TaxID=2567887 RepID=UPI002453E06B|nr:NAD(P)H-dependent oxidoreductase [Pseudomonas sp. BN411]MDH4561114.1 FMN-dependent NADH-azoreductase [Pseudomonas sp. BN411]
MTKILVIESSFQQEPASASRRITNRLLVEWERREPTVTIVRRDLGRNPPPHVSEALFTGLSLPVQERTPEQVTAVAAAQALIDELLDADVIVIGAPMYNFSVPSTLKCWIDNIAIAGKTFRYTAEGRPQGLVHGKRVYVIASRGGIYSEGPGAANNFQDTYLRAVLGLLGMTDFSVISAERQKMSADQQALGTRTAEQQIADALALEFSA